MLKEELMHIKKEKLRFLTPRNAKRIAGQFGTPVFVYDQHILEKKAREALAFPNAFGLTVRYAMKANPHGALLKIFDRLGLCIDASSGFEVERAVSWGIAIQRIMLTAQEMPKNLKALVERGMIFNACSLYQLESYGKLFPGTKVSIRINPRIGSGGTAWTNTGGPNSSFGIWHDYLDKIKGIAKKYNLSINRIHTHIGSGSDPKIWEKVALLSLRYVELFEEAKILNLGGGYKVARMNYEKETDFQEIGEPVEQAFIDLYERTGRKIRLEIEPGTYLVANAGSVICRVIDVVDTGKKGHAFIKVDSGMTEVTRPFLYGAEHPLVVLLMDKNKRGEDHYVISGHCCELGDSWTPMQGDPKRHVPRLMTRAKVGDLLVVEGVGAYCSGMSTKNYNSFPEAAEVLIAKDGEFHLIRKRQGQEEMYEKEIMPGFLK